MAIKSFFFFSASSEGCLGQSMLATVAIHTPLNSSLGALETAQEIKNVKGIR